MVVGEVEVEAEAEVEAAVEVVAAAAAAAVVAVAGVAAAGSGVEIGWAVVVVVVGPVVGVEPAADGLLEPEVLVSFGPLLSALAEQMTAVTQHCLAFGEVVQASGVGAPVSP